MTMAGIVVGSVAALATGRLLQRTVEGMQPTELSTVALMLAVLAFAALLASLVPARRASRIDPIRALRAD